MKATIVGFVVIVCLSDAAYAMTYYLRRDAGVQNNLRLCTYSNGQTYSFNATDLCPLDIEDDVSGPVPNSAPRQGFLKREYQDGLTKVCVYDVLGSEAATRLRSTAICPLNEKF